MVYANDQWVQLPTRDLYDSQIMAMAINAAKDMYEKGQQEMKDFTKLYGDFMTPIAGDQDKYNAEVLDPVRNTINAIYAAGGDPLRSPEARALISRTINNINAGKVARWRQRAENAKEYYKNLAELRAKDLYNEDYSRFLEEDPNMWTEDYMGVTSPTAYSDLNSKTSHWFDKMDKNQYLRTEGMYDIHGIKPEDLDSVMDQMMPDFINSNYGRYQMELAKRQLGPNATEGDVINQVRRNIVSANKEITLPTRTVNPVKQAEFTADLQFKKSLALQKGQQDFQERMARQAAKDKLDQIHARYGNKGGAGGNGSKIGQNYSLTESVHHDLLFQGLRNSGIKIPELTKDKNGKVVPKRDKDGKIVYKNPDDADYTELEYAANTGNYMYNMQNYIKGLTTKFPDYNKDAYHVISAVRNRYGGTITNIQLASMLKKKPLEDGGFYISNDELKQIRGANGLASDIVGSIYGMNLIDKQKEVKNTTQPTGAMTAKFTLSDSGLNNAIQVGQRYHKNRLETYVNGSLTYQWKDKEGHLQEEHVDDVWMPLGLNSERIVRNVSNVSLDGSKKGAYSSIDANYLKSLGQQQKVNLGLFANSLPMMIDPEDMTLEDYLEFLSEQQ